MQYLLTEEEYKALLKSKEDANNAVKKTVQELCTMVADHMPIGPLPWQKKDHPKEPWGCIITVHQQDKSDEHYCDHCPVQKMCPYPCKNWSK